MRIPSDLAEQLESEARGFGYRSLSPYVRMILDRRDSRELASPDADRAMAAALDSLVKQMRRIGTLYNQFVAAYNRAVTLRDREGNPRVSQRETFRNVNALRDLTVSLTESVHAILDRFGIPHEKVRASSPSQEDRTPSQGRVIIPKI